MKCQENQLTHYLYTHGIVLKNQCKDSKLIKLGGVAEWLDCERVQQSRGCKKQPRNHEATVF